MGSTLSNACISPFSELNHENLVPLLGVTEDAQDGKFYLVTELFPNGSLLSYLRSRGRALIGPATLLSFAT